MPRRKIDDYVPSIGDRIEVVGLHNDDACAKTPDKFIGKRYTIAGPVTPSSFREGTWQFATTNDMVFFAAIIEPAV